MLATARAASYETSRDHSSYVLLYVVPIFKNNNLKRTRQYPSVVRKLSTMIQTRVCSYTDIERRTLEPFRCSITASGETLKLRFVLYHAFHGAAGLVTQSSINS